jgi:hypothetical protein
MNKSKPLIKKDYTVEQFLDSGAFSAWSKKEEIDIDKYADYIKKNIGTIDHYANLDIIGDAEATSKNQKYLESVGLHPMPVFHYNEPFEALKALLDNYEYIALGGMVPITTGRLIPWLNEVFHLVCDEEGNATRKIHGFGMTTTTIIKRYPWYSVDSISPFYGAGFGRIYDEAGELDLSRNTGHVDLATRLYLEKNRQNFKFEELKEDYKQRIIYNIQFFLRLEKELTETPPKFKHLQQKLWQ